MEILTRDKIEPMTLSLHQTSHVANREQKALTHTRNTILAWKKWLSSVANLPSPLLSLKVLASGTRPPDETKTKILFGTGVHTLTIP